MTKEIPKNWQLQLDEEGISKCVTRLAHEIIEKEEDISNLAIVGIRTGGEFLAKRIHEQIEKNLGKEVSYGVIDITLYRDDLSNADSVPVLKSTDLPFAIKGSRIVLVDDVLFTGRTIKAALDAVIDFGRPAKIELAVLADRGHREFPIKADYVGKNLPTNRQQFVRVRFKNQDYAADGLYVIDCEGECQNIS